MAGLSRGHLTILHKADECIGCCCCAELIPQYFEMNDRGLAVLKGGRQTGVFRRARGLRMDQPEIEKAVTGCPVDIISTDG